MDYTIESIKQSLQTLDERLFFREYIASSECWYFSTYQEGGRADAMKMFKEIVSSQLRVSHQSTHIVGSAKIGCSLSPHKLFNPFRENALTPSDVDVVVVSLRFFSRFWFRLHDEQRFVYKKFYEKIIPSVFNGYISEGHLKRIGGIFSEWKELFSPVKKALQRELGIIHPINIRVYRCWEDFERYHIRGINFIKNRKKEINNDNVPQQHKNH